MDGVAWNGCAHCCIWSIVRLLDFFYSWIPRALVFGIYLEVCITHTYFSIFVKPLVL